MTAPNRYNLGAGDAPLEGYDNSFDRKQGRDCYPLQVPDSSADEIRASHILEHFSHRQALAVLRDWVRALKPGGLLKIAVPDFEYIAAGYTAGRPEPWTAYVCGAHSDANDVHLAMYDAPSLAALMAEAGLVGVHFWRDEHRDCAALPVSLNLAGWRPPAEWPKVVGTMSVPRLGFMDMFFSAVEMIAKLRIPLRKSTGAYWGQCMTRSIEAAIDEGAEWILALDYDSVFSTGTVVDLMATALLADTAGGPPVDALVPLQMSRASGVPLCVVPGPDGKPVQYLERSQMERTLMPILSGHFGCTLLRASAFARLPRPWFEEKPDSEGRWGDGRIDADITFWHKFRAAGLGAYLAPRCVIGHLQPSIIWPDINLANVLQDPSEYWKGGAPLNVWR